MNKITLIPGDGIGPEIAGAMKRCVEALDADVEWEVVEAGAGNLEAAIESLKRNKVGIKGPIVTPVGTGFRSVNVQLRQELDLFACVRPCKLYKGVRSNFKDVDIVVVRENTEGLYAGIEYDIDTDDANHLIEKFGNGKIGHPSAVSLKPISRFGSERIVRFAFEYAIANNRKKVTAVHKANIMKFSDGLFLRTAQEAAKDYEGRMAFEDRIVDNMCMQLVQKPQDYDVLVMPNLYGDILSDLCAGLVGGLGVAPGANIGTEIALFEPTHGAAPKYAGKNKVNPTAIILSAVLMLRHIGKREAADRLEKALGEVISEGESVTYDLKSDRNDPSAVGTQEMADGIVEKLSIQN